MDQENSQERSPLGGDQGITVRYQAENQPLEINLNQVNSFFTDLNKYNEQFSLGVMMARITLDRFEPEKSSIIEEEGKQQIDAFFLLSKHQNTLENMGLSLESLSGKTGKIFTGEGEAGESQMRINVTHHERFTAFLGALDPQQVEVSGLKGNLEQLTQILSQQVFDNYDLQAPGHEAIQLFSGMDKIISEYIRLGMEQATVKLETYLAHGKKGDLREHIAVEKYHLLSEPNSGHFGPGDWQWDTNEEQLAQKWANALNVLNMAKANPNAKEYFDQLSKHLSKCADVAMGNLTNDEKSHNRPGYPKIMENLKTAKSWVEKISNPDIDPNQTTS